MQKRDDRVVGCVITALFFALLTSLLSPIEAAHSNINHSYIKVMDPVSVGANLTGSTTVFLNGRDPSSNDAAARGGLGICVDQSALIQGAGTSPNFKVEALCSMDGVVFVKPEVGGDVGTFTDANPHFCVISIPLSPGGIKLKFTELGGNALTAYSTVAGQ